MDNSLFNPSIVLNQGDSQKVHAMLEKEANEIMEEMLVITMLVYRAACQDNSDGELLLQNVR
jgi:hypothetical protein